MELHVLLKEKRVQQELTQEQLAEKIFVSNKTISNWENGKTTPDLDSLIRLATFFHLSLDNLLLEGSDTVENIKKIEVQKLVRKYYWISWGTNLFFLLTLITQQIFDKVSSISTLFFLFAVIFNSFTLRHFYFSVKSEYNNQSPFQLLQWKNKLLFILTVVLLMILIFFMIENLP